MKIKNKKVRIAVKIAIFMLVVLLVITSAIIGFKLLFRKYYRRPVPISPFMSYGQGIDERGERVVYIPYEANHYEVITP